MPDSNRKQSAHIDVPHLDTRLSIDDAKINRNDDEFSVDTVYERSIQQHEHQQDDYSEHSPLHKKLILYKDRIKKRLPTYSQIRKTLKGAIALELAVIFALQSNTRRAIGDAVLLVPITMVFYFPVRAIGVQIEAVLYGTFGALISAGWSILGLYLADLARDKSQDTALQPGVCAILAVFLFIGTFVLVYVRRRYHSKANFACVNACNLLVFAMTESALRNRFDAELAWSYLRPISAAGALAIAVDVFLWPDDSLAKYLTIFQKTVKDYNDYFRENSDAFLSPAINDTSKATPNHRLKGSALLLIDCKRAAQREVLFTKISASDLSELTRIIKSMRQPLNGIGLSVNLRQNLTTKGRTNPFLHDVHDMDSFHEALDAIRDKAQNLTNACHTALKICTDRAKQFHGGERTTWGSILWPFPRLFTLSRNEPLEDTKLVNAYQQVLDCLRVWDANAAQGLRVFIKKNSPYSPERIPEYGPLHLLALYEFSLRMYTTTIIALLEFVNKLESTRRGRRRLRLPCVSLRKWFRPEDLDALIGDDPMSDLQRTTTNQSNVSEGVIRSVPRSESKQLDDPADNCGFRKADTGEVHYRDPDVTAPGTTREWAFYGLHRVHRWLSKHEPLMALKAATGVVLLAIPSWRANTAHLYYEWRGQWALITMVLWMFPTTGRYIFLLIMRVSGSILGCLIGVTIWEISNGNPYGIAVLCFAFFVPIYYIFFFTTTYKVAMFLSKVTLLLVIIYEYNNLQWGNDIDEPVYVIAAKRLAMIAVGLVSSLILSLIPSPVTGRVELRKRLAKTVRDIGRLYGILVASYIVKPKRGAMPTESQIKRFRKLSTELRRQIADERNLLAHAMYEPPLRGKFPTAEYKTMIDKVDNMADLVHGMGRSVLYINPEWKKVIGHTLMNDRRDYLATVMTTLKLISTTLAAKTTLPPYMIQPHEMRRRFTEDIERKIHIGSREIADPTFTRYCTYMLSSSAFINELQKLLDTVKQLVGIEDPNEWLYLHYQ